MIYDTIKTQCSDALNTHDASYELAIAGGVTSAQILPGSANNIGEYKSIYDSMSS